MYKKKFKSEFKTTPRTVPIIFFTNRISIDTLNEL